MKTFRAIIVTFMVTVVLGMGGLGAFLINEGIVTIERRDVNHTEVVMRDGEVVKERNWSEVLGYELKVDILDNAYIGF